VSEQESRPPRDIIRAVPPAALMRAAADGAQDQRPVLFGFFARFDEWTEIDSYFEGNFLERLVPGAFKKTFAETRDQIRVLFQHGRDQELRDRPIGEPEVLEEQDQGAYHESRLFDGLPDLVMEGLRAGQYGQSFRMQIMREEFVEEPGPSDYNPKGLPERSIKEVRLFEYGPVTFPAYANTTPGVRSLNDHFVFDWIAKEPTRARELVGAADLSSAALTGRAPEQQAAPSPTDAAREGTSGQERRDASSTGRYGLTHDNQKRPSWAL
jgi:HK97 family phage prohead protease